VIEEIRIDKARTQEQIAVQEQEILRKEKELEATVVKPANAQRTAQILQAEAAQQAAVLEAEGRSRALIAIAEAEQERLRKEGAGRAAAIEAEGRAEAAKIEAIGLAQARAIEAQGLAEAAAIQKKSEAWRQFNEAARLQTILEKLPAIIEATAPVFSAIAAPIGAIDKVVVIEQGAGANGQSSGINRFAAAAPSVVFGLLQQLEAVGLDVSGLLKHVGVAQSTDAPSLQLPVTESETAFAETQK
jgi:flotillin